MGRAYLWALPDDERANLMREIKEHVGSNWPKVRDGIERAGECIAKHGFAMSAGEWHSDIHAVGVALKLNDGTGPYAFNCGAPAFKFSEVLLQNSIGPRLVAMVRNIETALTGSVARGSQNKETTHIKKMRNPGGKVARIVEGIR